MTDGRRQYMRKLNDKPDFAAARDERSRQRFTEENENLQRLANIAKRGCDVPPEQETEWNELKRMKIPNREAARILGMEWLGDPDDAVDAQWGAHRACDLVDELIDLIETNRTLDPDFAYDLIDRSKCIKRILEWNSDKTGELHGR